MENSMKMINNFFEAFPNTIVLLSLLKYVRMDNPLQTMQLTFFFSLGLVLSKLQGKVVTHSHDLVWWSFLMVECVTNLGANCT